MDSSSFRSISRTAQCSCLDGWLEPPGSDLSTRWPGSCTAPPSLRSCCTWLCALHQLVLLTVDVVWWAVRCSCFRLRWSVLWGRARWGIKFQFSSWNIRSQSVYPNNAAYTLIRARHFLSRTTHFPVRLNVSLVWLPLPCSVHGERGPISCSAPDVRRLVEFLTGHKFWSTVLRLSHRWSRATSWFPEVSFPLSSHIVANKQLIVTATKLDARLRYNLAINKP